MTLQDIINNINTYIGDSSNDRISASDRYQAATEGTAWLLEELGNEHMVDKAEIEFLPTVTWYKMDNLTPYLLTAGELNFKEQEEKEYFTRIESRDLDTMSDNRYAYAIEQYDGNSYIGITIPSSSSYPYKDLIQMNKDDGLTYTGTNAVGIVAEKDAIRFDMQNTGVTATGLSTTSSIIDVSSYESLGVFIFEVEIPDITDVTSVSIKFGTNLSTDYYLGTVAQDINGNALVEGVNTIKVAWSDLSSVGTVDLTAVTKWQILVNHNSSKPIVEKFRLSDLRIAKPLYLDFKYIFYRVGKDTSGADITEFTAVDDVPFFAARYPQYKFAVAHKASAILYRSLQLYDSARQEDREAINALSRYRKNFATERDTGSSTFKVAGISFRNRRFSRRRI